MIQQIRIPLTIWHDTKKIRRFFVDLAKTFLPDVIDEILETVQEKADDVFIEVWNILVSLLGGMKKSKTLNKEGMDGSEEPG